MIDTRHRPLQMIFSFEGFINGLTGSQEVLVSQRPANLDLSDFENRVRRGLANLKDLGVGGVVVNVGYERYLENEDAWGRFFAGLRLAGELGLRVWIYDENGYPSGTAGGKVLDGHPELEAFGLKQMMIDGGSAASAIPMPEPRATVFVAYGIRADGSRERLSAVRGASRMTVADNKFSHIEVYFLAPLFEGTHAAGNLSASRRYVNLLDRRAVSRFLRLTHARYFEKMPPELHPHVEAFFTDEPSLLALALPNSTSKLAEDAVDTNLPLFPSVPWCETMEVEFLSDHGYALGEQVPALFTGQGRRERKVRRDFRRTVSRLYRSSHAAQMADVCAAFGVDCSGHFLGEDSILQQAILHADLIQSLKQFHRPGLDLLTCRLDLFDNHILAHKSALSASVFGSGKGVMSETSDYFECYGSELRELPVEEIQCVLALQYLLGVRDFVSLFEIQRLGSDRFRAILDFAGLLVESGQGRSYQPEAALYYPIELVWERYLPTCPTGDVFSAGIFGHTVDVKSRELESLCKATTEACRQLFYANVQYLLCERDDIARLGHHGIRELVYHSPIRPPADLVRLCRDVGITLTDLDHCVALPQRTQRCLAGANVLYATFDGFVFAVNRGPHTSSITAPGCVEAMRPLAGRERSAARGPIELAPYECVFLFDR